MDSPLAMESYERQIRIYAAQLQQAIASEVEKGHEININQYFHWFSFDVMGQFAFSKSFGMLRNQHWHYSIGMLRAGRALLGPFTPVPWLVRISFDIPILRIVRDFQAMLAWCTMRMDERIEVRMSC